MGRMSVNRAHEFVKTSLRVHHNKKGEEHCVRASEAEQVIAKPPQVLTILKPRQD